MNFWILIGSLFFNTPMGINKVDRIIYVGHDKISCEVVSSSVTHDMEELATADAEMGVVGWHLSCLEFGGQRK